jgi:3-deoxy-D-manno-octulosonic-acid transferase
MDFLYNLSINIFAFLVRLVVPFNPKAALFVKGRKNWATNLKAKIGDGGRYIWVHCASLGEFEQGRPVIEEVKSRYPTFRIILTFYSPSGYEVRKNYQGADVVCYLPFDTKKNARRFLDIISPEKIFFVKYEYWPNYMRETKRRNIPFYMISCIFRDNQIFFKNHMVGAWFRKQLRCVTLFFVQNSESVKLLAEIGFTNASISGDTRFDRVTTIASTVKNIPEFNIFKGDKPLLIVGSSWQPDEEIAIQYINQTESIKAIIAPHEVTEINLKRIKESLHRPSEFYSKIGNMEIDRYDVIIIDSVGLLSSLYQYGDAAYIGGGFGVGIHNILEAATFGLPVVFGPNYKKFKEAVDLANLGVAFPVHNFDQARLILDSLFNNSGKLIELSKVARQYISTNTGATRMILESAFSG